MNPWSAPIILANVIHIIANIRILTFDEEEEESLGRSLGVATCLLLVALNKYLLADERYANLPNTLIGSMGGVASGILGLLPLLMGTAVIGNV